MKIVIDMNLSPAWVRFLEGAGFETVHLAATEATGPSVLQVRTQDVVPEAIGGNVVQVLLTHREALEQGAIISVDMVSSRVRVLPIRNRAR